MYIPAEYQPHPALSPFVKCYWTLNGCPDRSAHGIDSGQYKQFLSDSGVKIIFNLAEPVEFVLHDGQKLWTTAGCVCGVLSKNYWVHLTGVIDSVGVQFHPGGAYPFLPFSVKQLTDTVCDLYQIWSHAGYQLTEKIQRPDLSTAHRIGIMEAFLLKRLKAFKKRDAVFEHAAHALITRQGQISLDSLMRHLGLSYRQLERKFHQKGGMAPKRLCRILRFRYLFEHISANPDSSWVDTALSCGYYDQAHLIHDFRRFTGMSPATFVKEVVNQDLFINWGYDMEALARFGMKVSI
jgi:AraC-like DNA-binding protein